MYTTKHRKKMDNIMEALGKTKHLRVKVFVVLFEDSCEIQNRPCQPVSTVTTAYL